MLIGFFCYWAVAMPTAFMTAFIVPLGATGIWIGLAAGLFVAATLLGWRLLGMTRRVFAIGLSSQEPKPLFASRLLGNPADRL